MEIINKFNILDYRIQKDATRFFSKCKNKQAAPFIFYFAKNNNIKQQETITYLLYDFFIVTYFTIKSDLYLSNNFLENIFETKSNFNSDDNYSDDVNKFKSFWKDKIENELHITVDTDFEIKK